MKKIFKYSTYKCYYKSSIFLPRIKHIELLRVYLENKTTGESFKNKFKINSKYEKA